MSAKLTEEEFSKHVNTKFRVKGDNPIEIELTQVKGYPSKPHEQAGMERFSAFFNGPADHFLEQKIYSIEHEGMGEFELFLVPVAQDAKGFRYESVFNYFKTE